MSKSKIIVYGLLALSLAVNVFVAGAVVGKRSNGPGAGAKGGPPPVDFNMRRIGQYLSEEGRARAQDLLRGQRRDLRAQFMTMRQFDLEIREIMLAETVDKEALRRAVEAREAAQAAMRSPLARVMVDVVADEPLENRKVIIQMLTEKRRSLLGGPRGPRRPRRPPPE